MVGPRLTQQVAEAFLPHPPEKLGVAVSGGGDSMALLHLMHGFCTLHGARLFAVTVNHGLRAEAASEAGTVKSYCASLGISHDTLLWDAWDGRGNLQSLAREARYKLMGAWAQDQGVSTVALGHTADDQAETVLMRLARSAGVDGLSAIPHRMVRDGVTWVRPLLGASRSELRSYLQNQRIPWIEDPSNDDPHFARVKARRALAVLADLDIDAKGLAQVAAQMSAARKALDWQTFLAAREIVTVDAGAVVLDQRLMRIQPEEIQRRLIVQALTWVSGGAYPPRRGAIAELLAALRRGTGGTVDGCHARRVAGNIWVFRELNAVRDTQSAHDVLWDARWRLSPLVPETDAEQWDDVVVRALGPEGLEQCPKWRDTGRPHAVLMSTPAVWRGDTVVAAPLAREEQNWHADIEGGAETFFAALLSH